MCNRHVKFGLKIRSHFGKKCQKKISGGFLTHLVYMVSGCVVGCVAVQSDISELERTRESMARELVSVCIQNEDLTGKLSYHEVLQQKYSVSRTL